MADESTLEDRCLKYWDKYLEELAVSIDGQLLLEQATFNVYRSAWLDKEMSITRVYRSMRFVKYKSVLHRCLHWCASISSKDSTPSFDIEEVSLLIDFPESL